jgi:hypothetical protein
MWRLFVVFLIAFVFSVLHASVEATSGKAVPVGKEP